MITRRFKTLFTQSFKNPSNPNFSFTYSLLYSSQTQKIPEESNAISDYFVKEHQFPSEVAVKAASSLSHLKTPEKCAEVLSFFKGIGFSNMDLEKIVGSSSGPNVLCAKVENTLKPKIKTFQDLGFSNDDIVSIVSSSPWLLLHSGENRILESLLVLKNVLGSVDLVAKLLKVSDWFINRDLEKTLIPNIEFLKSCGIHSGELIHHLSKFPRLFLLTPENLKKLVKKVDEMKFPRESKMYFYAIACLCKMSEVSWEKKVQLFRSLGFTEDQISQMFLRAPFAFVVSEEKITEVVQVISGSSMYDSSDIVKYPTVLSSSVERRLKPRLRVLETLGNGNLLRRHPCLQAAYLIPDVKFIERFITPYLDQLADPKYSFAYSIPNSTQTPKILEKTNAISDYFVKEHQFSSEVAMKAASSLAHLKTPAKCDAVLSFLKGIGFSNMDLQKLVESSLGPTILCAKVDNTIKPKIKIFQDLGFSNDDIVSIVSTNPWFLFRKANNRIFSSLLVLKNVLGSVDLVAKLLKISSWSTNHDLEKTLVPNIEFLRSCGIQLEQLTHHIFSRPRLFFNKQDSLRRLVEKVDEMKFPKESKLYLYAIMCLSTMSEVNFQRKLELFRSLGFTEDQILQMFYKKPHALKRSQGTIKEVVQVVSDSLIYDSLDIVRHPTVFTCSVERRLKPRIQVLEILSNKNLISRPPGFSVAYLITDKEFIERFVTPYIDVLGDIDFLTRGNS